MTETPEYLDLASPNLVHQNIEKIATLFPHCVTETAEGFKIDFDLLKQELSEQTIVGNAERYRLEWPGKREAIVTANMPTNKTLRPVLEDSVNFDTTENIYIEGDNLEVLKLLQESYLSKVKMIYIDPPYNTGNDFVYKDNFTQSAEEYKAESGLLDEYNQRLVTNLDTSGRYHSDWLTMIYPRLKLARNLLTDDGVTLISIDEIEVHNLRKICDEVFGENNFTGEIIWKNSSKNDQDYISIQHEYILCYVKDKNTNHGAWTEKKEGLNEIYKAFESFKKKHGDDWDAIHQEALSWYKQFPESNPVSSSKHYNWMDKVGIYFASDISGPNHGQYVFDVIHPITGQNCKSPASGWRFPKETIEKKILEGSVHFGKDHNTVPNNKTYLYDTEFQSLTSIRYKDGRVASKNLAKLFGENLFTNPKDSDLIFELFKSLEVSKDDIILDFFSGSATTAESTLKLNYELGIKCKYIMVQIPEDLNETLKTATGGSKATLQRAIDFLIQHEKTENICEIGKERIRRAGKKIVEEQKGNLAQLQAKLLVLEGKLSAGNGSLLMDNDPKVEALKTEQAELQIQITELTERIENLDTGFRVYRLDSSNMKDVYYNPKGYAQDQLEFFADNIKEDRSAEDLVAQIMLDWGLSLSLKIEKVQIAHKEVFKVAGDSLFACFDKEIDEHFAREIAKEKPLRVVFRDASFKGDKEKVNVFQLLKQLSPNTEMRVI